MLLVQRCGNGSHGAGLRGLRPRAGLKLVKSVDDKLCRLSCDARKPSAVAFTLLAVTAAASSSVGGARFCELLSGLHKLRRHGGTRVDQRRLLFREIIGQLAHLRCCRKLEWLSLDRTQVTDEGLGHLAGMPKLSNVDLSGTHITDGAVDRLKAIPHLDCIWRSGTGLTDHGVEQLKARFPELVVQN